MKKTVKGLIIAASVAAVVGVGAVSFAAWSGNTTTRDVTTKTGSLETYGITVKTDGLAGNVWVPYDQDLTNNSVTNGVKVWDIEIEYDGGATAEKTYTLNIKYDSTVTATEMQNCMYVYAGAAAYEAPTTTIDFDSSTDWQKITGSDVAIGNFTAGTDTNIHVIFDSSTNAQMTKDVKLVLTLTNA